MELKLRTIIAAELARMAWQPAATHDQAERDRQHEEAARRIVEALLGAGWTLSEVAH